MKRVLYILAAILLAFTVKSYAQNNLNELWDQANTKYINGDYRGAIQLYDSIQSMGYESDKLYYNLGNAYFKDGKTGKAIVNYNKAQRLSPSDSDIAYNLAVANSYVKDKNDSIPQFFLKRWVHSLRNTFNTNSWAILSLVFLAIGLICTLVYLLSQNIVRRKTGFYGGLVGLLLFVASLTFALVERHELTDASDAIVISNSIPVKSSPDKASTDIFILHEGTKVAVQSVYGQWSEIMIANGNKGWLPNYSIEMIN